MERSCGSCSLCCKLLSIEGVEDRPGWTWCQHCRPGKGGCTIYDHRPAACANFVCGWLSGALDTVLDPERWHPAKARMMITAEAVDPEVHVVIQVDPNFPDRWREAPYRADIQYLAAAIPRSQRLFVRVKYRLIEIRATERLSTSLLAICPNAAKSMTAPSTCSQSGRNGSPCSRMTAPCPGPS